METDNKDHTRENEKCTNYIPYHTHNDKDDKKESHMKDAPGFKDGREINPRCRDREHNAPGMMCVPYGKMYVHYCPSCGHKSVIMGSTATLSAV